MNTNRRGRVLAGLISAGAAIALAAVGLPAPVALADVGGSFATAGNASDPFVMKCFDRDTQLNGYCMYTSQDMGVPGPPGNGYPMENTLGFFSTDGRGWTPRGVVFGESQIATNNGGFVPPGARHLWAPAALQEPGGDTFLFVPDVASVAPADPQNPWGPNVHTSSRIAVAAPQMGEGAFGPFVSSWTLTDESGGVPGYMSDPEPFRDSTGQYLLWANGDGDTCGGLSVGRLSFGLELIREVQEIAVTGFPSSLSSCTRTSPFSGTVSHPYMEGPSLFKFADLTTRTGLPGPYTLVFAAKPTGVPPGCNAGSPTANEVIAYATSATVTGPYAYQGILMCGSETEWTNQATLTEMTTPGGAQRLVMIYHDGPAGAVRNRKLHAECMFFGRATIAAAIRNATGFTDCMNGADANAWVLRSRAVAYPPQYGIVSADLDRSGWLYASRSTAGPWERFDVLDENSVPISPTSAALLFHVRLRAHANNRYVCAENAGSGGLIANRTAVGLWEKYALWIVGDGTAQLDSEASSRGVNTQSSQQLVPTSPPRAPQEYFDILHL